MAFLEHVVRWEGRGDYHVLNRDVPGSMLAMYFVLPGLIEEQAESPRA